MKKKLNFKINAKFINWIVLKITLSVLNLQTKRKKK